MVPTIDFNKTSAQIAAGTYQMPQTGVAPGTGPLLTGSQPVPTTRPTALQSVGSFLSSDAFTGILDTGFKVWQGYEAKEASKDQLRLAQQRAASEAALAKAQIELAQTQQKAALEMAKNQGGGGAAGGGLPSWLLPAGLAAAGLVTVFLITKKK